MIISGGIDLSVGSMMSLVNVVAARCMLHMSFREALALLARCSSSRGALAGALTGLLIVVTRVADIIVTLAMLFVWAGVRAGGADDPGRRHAARASARSSPSTRSGPTWFPAALADPDRASSR